MDENMRLWKGEQFAHSTEEAEALDASSSVLSSLQLTESNPLRNLDRPFRWTDRQTTDEN
jgi:hypothetical protein